MANQIETPSRNPMRLEWIKQRRALNALARAKGFANARVWDDEGESRD